MIKSLRQILTETPALSDDAAIAQCNGQSPEPKPSSAATFVTYTSIGQDKARFGAGAINVAGRLRDGLAAWCDAGDLSQIDVSLPNPGALRIIHARLSGSTGQDVASEDAPTLLALFAAGVGPTHPSLLTQQQAGAILSVGYVMPPTVTLDDVVDARREIAKAGWMADKLTADAAASALIDADPLNADPAVVGAAYAAELVAAVNARRAPVGGGEA